MSPDDPCPYQIFESLSVARDLFEHHVKILSVFRSRLGFRDFVFVRADVLAGTEAERCLISCGWVCWPHQSSRWRLFLLHVESTDKALLSQIEGEARSCIASEIPSSSQFQLPQFKGRSERPSFSHVRDFQLGGIHGFERR